MRTSFLPVCVFAFLIVTSCASWDGFQSTGSASLPAETASRDAFWFSYPAGNLVLLGGAAMRTNRKEAIEFALKDAARKAAMYDVVSGTIRDVEKTGTGAFDYSLKTKTRLQESGELQEFVDALEYNEDTDVRVEGNSIFVRARYAHRIVPDAVYAGSAGARPAWVTSSPDFPGYYTGVGYAGSHSRLSDTVKTSYENAIFAIIRQISVRVINSDVALRSNSSSGYSVRTLTAKGTVNGFYVLETWIDPETNAVWTLAIARRESEVKVTDEENEGGM